MESDTVENMEIDQLEASCDRMESLHVDNRQCITFNESCLVELSKSSWYPSSENIDKQTYLRGCKWSPDGTCCLTVVNYGGVHLLELPRDLYSAEEVDSKRPIDILDSTLKIPESGLVYDFCWYPGMNSGEPETCCWLTSRQHSPIQLWDAYDGSLRCSYRGYDAADEVEPALSLCFSFDSSQIHAGYKKTLKTFDVTRPGREYVNQAINICASCLCISPSSESLIAVGSWNKEISLYDIHQGSTKSIGKLKFHSGGVTNIAFLPDGEKLISGARKDTQLLMWDIRFYRRPYKIMNRTVATNQRIYFDISKCGRYLVSGGTDGVVSVWDLNDEVIDINADSPYTKTLYPLHNDCCNGVSIHPFKPIIATCSGQHHIRSEGLKESCEDLSQSNTEDERCVENSLIFWWTGKVKQ